MSKPLTLDTAQPTLILARNERRKRCAESCAESFEHHVYRNLSGGSVWYGGKPGTGTYAFRVVLLPGAVIVTGDIGDCIFHPHDRDVAEWLRRAVDDMDYMLGKVHGEFNRKEFELELAAAALREMSTARPDFEPELEKSEAEEILVACRYEPRASTYYQECSDRGDFEPYDPDDWTFTMMACYHAIRMLVKAKGPELKVLE